MCDHMYMCTQLPTCRDINVKVYHVGFAKEQEGYDKEVRVLFTALDRVG